MAYYREPCSSIFLFKGCPCDRSYNNTIYFETPSLQWLYFRDHYFGNRAKSYTNQYYQRYAKGTLRIMEKADNLYEFNYMAFCNDNGFNPLVGPTSAMKVFYCFIDSIEYINENVTEVTYTIDVIQTYMFNYTLGYCMVEREHTISDQIGQNKIPEPFEGKDYYYTILKQTTMTDTDSNPAFYLMIRYVPRNKYICWWEYQSGNYYIDYQLGEIGQNVQGWYEPTGEIRNGVYSGAKILYIPLLLKNTPLNNPYVYYNLERAINILVQNNAVITEITLVPNFMVNLSRNALPPTFNYDDGFTLSTNQNIEIERNITEFRDGAPHTYTPNNNKLYQYPYDMLTVIDNNGNEKDYYWEDFLYRRNNNDKQFAIFNMAGCVNSETELCIIPKEYNGMSTNYAERVNFTNFPSIAWSEDSFSRMWSEHKNKITSGLIQAAISTIASIFGGMGYGVATEAVGQTVNNAISSGIKSQTTRNAILNAPATNQKTNRYIEVTGTPDFSENLGSIALVQGIAGLIDAYNKPNNVKGQQTGSQIPILLNKFGFTIVKKSIKPYYAKQIDNFFDMFGYAIKELKIPNIASESASNLRPHWNYIKNANTVILPKTSNNTTTYVDLDVEEKLQSIYNKGITFWMNGEEVGDYSRENSPNV